MIIVTGAAGFIGSCLTSFLNKKGLKNIVLVDDFCRIDKKKNLINKQNIGWVPRGDFFSYMGPMMKEVSFVYHIGARTDTAEKDENIFNQLNLNYSKRLWEVCAENNIPFVYASSAATYGNGEKGFEDRHDIVSSLQPMNAYAKSKNSFDQWVLEQKKAPPFWAGLKFFNVYGPNEYHKGRMASVIYHAYNQIRKTGGFKLFKSHNPDFKDGEQKRDFIYVKDLNEVLWFLHQKRPDSGIYNLGTGEARTFNDLVSGIYSALDKSPSLEYIDTPEDIRDKYQYFTKAEMNKLRAAGFDQSFTSLEDGINDYVSAHLKRGNLYY